MALTLGIHNGHHASCAIVRDGALVAGVEQERLTRRKGDGSSGLSRHLPVRRCLEIAGASLDDLDLIVSSFQAIGPGGAGFNQPLVEPGFGLFDPFDARHCVVSHHYAHALCALGTSGFQEAAVLVCDLAGSTTRSGEDYAMGFTEFAAAMSDSSCELNTRTECLSIYDADDNGIRLRHREFCVPHSAPDVFVYSAATLYDNVARMVFGRENAHGQLMALASIDDGLRAPVRVGDIVDVEAPGVVRFRNGWQHRVTEAADCIAHAPLAHVVQAAFERAVLEHARRASLLTDAANLAAAGGVFLNINSNSAIAASGLFQRFFVPSAPHDAGIAVGCAYHGWRLVAKKLRATPTIHTRRASDRIGGEFKRPEIDAALEKRRHLVVIDTVPSPQVLARHIREGQIVARFEGHAEFGPRALGGRSLLATPLLAASKDRLNVIKGRQHWRPVAPVALRDRAADLFEGPAESPYMNMEYRVRALVSAMMPAIRHPDGSARVQTVTDDDDRSLCDLLRACDALTGLPVLVNTSLNGAEEPIVETPEQALDFFLAHDDVAILLIGGRIVRRMQMPDVRGVRLAPDTIVTIINPGASQRVILLRRGRSLEISGATFRVLTESGANGEGPQAFDGDTQQELIDALRQQFVNGPCLS